MTEVNRPPAHTRDAVEGILQQWQHERPDLDVSSMGIVGRIQRAGRILGSSAASYLTEQGMEPWEFDVLATLRRSGQLTAGELTRASMVTAGAMTGRVDRLVDRGLVQRQQSPHSRRTLLIDLTPEGRDLVDEVVVGHVNNLDHLIAHLTTRERSQLARLLQRFLVGLGDQSDETSSSSEGPDVA